MLVKLLLKLSWVFLLAACVQTNAPPTRIALLAPFEGTQREIGYNALYAVRLALADSATEIELIAIDDGGTENTATDRIQAIMNDSSIASAIVISPSATKQNDHFANITIPTFIIGNWNPIMQQENVYEMRHPGAWNAINEVTDNTETDLLIGGDLLTLEQVPQVVDDLNRIRVISTGQPADDEFSQRYRASDEFVPEPNLLATLTYDVTGLIIELLEGQNELSGIRYSGITGDIHIENSVWENAPLYTYQYNANGDLELIPEQSPQ